MSHEGLLHEPRPSPPECGGLVPGQVPAEIMCVSIQERIHTCVEFTEQLLVDPGLLLVVVHVLGALDMHLGRLVMLEVRKWRRRGPQGEVERMVDPEGGKPIDL